MRRPLRVPGAGPRTVLVTLVALGALVGPLAAASAARTGTAQPPVRRILVVSLPHVTWSDLAEADVPNLRALLARSAVADLAVRVQRLNTRPADGYATIGAGTRAVAPPLTAGLAFEPGEQVEGGTAAVAFERRTGRALDGGAGHLWVADIERANEAALFGGEAGTLGEALRAGGWRTAVVANADWSLTDRDDESYHREAVEALMDQGGRVACGQVGRELLEPDAASPFGVRLDQAAVVAAFARCWQDRSVVLVEASDVARAEAYRLHTSDTQHAALFRTALEASDALVGRLLESVDTSRDAIVIVAPASPEAVARLTVLGIRAPGVRPGLLSSPSTRRAGFVAIADVGPTLADLAGLDRPDAMEGRAVNVEQAGGDGAERVRFLVDKDRDARFRDRILAAVIAFFITGQILLSGGAIVALATRHPRLERVLEAGSLGLLSILPLTYLSALLPFARWGTGAYVLFVIGGAVVLSVAAEATRREKLLPLELVLGLMLAVTTVSVVLLDSRLQLSTVFGDSPIVAGRFSGVNNLTFAQLMAAAILLAAILVHRHPGRPGLWGAFGLLGAVLVVDAAPMWGADVGGILAGLPAVVLVAVLLGGHRIRLRTVAVGVLVTLGTLFALGALDLARPSSQRTHLGRLFERVAADGWDGFATVVQRKFASNVATITGSAWSVMIVPMLLFAALLAWKAPSRLRGLEQRIPELRVALAGLLVAGALGYAFNDSGVAVPGMMLAVLNAALVYLLVGSEAVP